MGGNFMSKNNKLVFDVYCDAVTKLASVSCIEGVGAIVSYTEEYTDFAKAHRITADNLERVIKSLDDVFVANDIENDLELVRVSMSLLEAPPFMLYLEYHEDTVSSKLNFNKKHVKEIDRNSVDFNQLFFPSPMGLSTKGDVPEMFDVNNFMLGSKKKPEPKEEPKRTSLTFDDVVGMHEVKDKLRDVIDQFKNAEKYEKWKYS